MYISVNDNKYYWYYDSNIFNAVHYLFNTLEILLRDYSGFKYLLEYFFSFGLVYTGRIMRQVLGRVVGRTLPAKMLSRV